MIGALSPEEIDAVLRRQRLGRLACTVGDRPFVVPINYAYDGANIYAASGFGRKIEAMRRRPLVCFEVDEVDGPHSWRSVVAEAVYEELTEERARSAALQRLGVVVGEPPTRGLDRRAPVVVFRLRLTGRSGRFERYDGPARSAYAPSGTAPLRLRALRIELGLTQQALAARAGVSAPTISRLERGRGGPPRPRIARRLAAALEVDPRGVVELRGGLPDWAPRRPAD
jgi:nitroimidazol reductase NimA-like FMN-containing flavoprotein (pyridoxamine 5'-phosphate oxidase superfamily)/DNA-binding XRE family transcriptional regulator